jgi:hypothetical protein
MIIYNFDVGPSTWGCLHDVANEREIDFVMDLRFARGVHQLNRKIDALGRCIGAIFRHDVLFAQDGR